jgi:hypothetical protein
MIAMTFPCDFAPELISVGNSERGGKGIALGALTVGYAAANEEAP